MRINPFLNNNTNNISRAGGRNALGVAAPANAPSQNSRSSFVVLEVSDEGKQRLGTLYDLSPEMRENILSEVDRLTEEAAALRAASISSTSESLLRREHPELVMDFFEGDALALRILNELEMNEAMRANMDTRTRWDLSIQLSNAINAAASMPDASLEERAFMRESAIRMARYISENHLPEEYGQRLVSLVESMASMQERNEMGYINGDRRPHMLTSHPGSAPDFLFWVRNHLSSPESFELWDMANDLSRFIIVNEDGTTRLGEGVHAMMDLIRRYGPLQARMHRTGELDRWLQRQDEEFDANVAAVQAAADNARNNFDALLNDQRFNSVVSWNNHMMSLLSGLS